MPRQGRVPSEAHLSSACYDLADSHLGAQAGCHIDTANMVIIAETGILSVWYQLGYRMTSDSHRNVGRAYLCLHFAGEITGHHGAIVTFGLVPREQALAL